MTSAASRLRVADIDGVTRIEFVDRNILDEANIQQIGEEIGRLIDAQPQPKVLISFDNVDHLTSNVMLPLGGLFIVVFAGWVMCRNSTADELGGAGTVFKLWRFLARVVAPVGILFVFLKAVGLLPDLS